MLAKYNFKQGNVNLDVEILNGRVITINIVNGNLSLAWENDENSLFTELSEVCISDKISFEVGKLLKVKIEDKYTYYPIKHLKQINGKTMSFQILADERTKASLFLLPLLGHDFTYFGYTTFLVNAYQNLGQKEYLVLRYRFVGNTKYKELEHKLKQDANFISLQDTDKYHVNMLFKFPTDHSTQDIISDFWSGKYSKFPERYKKQILSFHKAPKDGMLDGVLRKSPKRKQQLELELGDEISDQELFSSPTISQEIYSINNPLIDISNSKGVINLYETKRQQTED